MSRLKWKSLWISWICFAWKNLFEWQPEQEWKCCCLKRQPSPDKLLGIVEVFDWCCNVLADSGSLISISRYHFAIKTFQFNVKIKSCQNRPWAFLVHFLSETATNVNRCWNWLLKSKTADADGTKIFSGLVYSNLSLKSNSSRNFISEFGKNDFDLNKSRLGACLKNY